MGNKQEVNSDTSARPVTLSASKEGPSTRSEGPTGITTLAAVTVNSYVFACTLLDSCSNICMITRAAVALVEAHGRKKLPFEAVRGEVNGVGDKMSPIEGYVTVDLTVADDKLKAQRLAVVDSIVGNYKLLIGTPQIEALGGNIDIDTHTWRLRKGGKVPYSVRAMYGKERVLAVMLSEDVLLEPRSGRVVSAQLGGGDWGKLPGVLMVEPTTKKQALPEFVALGPGPRRVDQHNKGAMVVELLNSGYGRHRLKKGTVVGWASEVDLVAAVTTDMTPLPAGTEEEKRSEAARRLDAAIDKAVSESGDLSNHQKERLKALLMKHRKVFTEKLQAPGGAKLPPHEINTGDSAPIRLQPHRASHVEEAIIDSEVEKLKDVGAIEDAPADCAYSAPVVIVKKKNGELRFCVDYRKLNAVTVRVSYPLPRIQDILGRLRAAVFYTSMDLVSGYYQHPLFEGHKNKTAFVTRTGVYVFKVLPMGLCNAPSTFQRGMDIVLKDLVGKCCFVYLDDVIVFSSSFDAHLQHLEAVLSKFAEFNLQMKINKCKFARKEILFLGYIVSGEGVRVNPELIRVVRDAPPPRDAKAVHRFLGLTSFYRQFVFDYAAVTEPLQRLLRKGERFIWGHEQQYAFSILKRALHNAPILLHPDYNKPFSLWVDGQDVALGGVLTQQDGDGIHHPVAYGSHLLDAAERRYGIPEKECLALIYFTKLWRQHLHGRRFTAYTDHEALQHLKDFRDPRGRLARWCLELQQLDMQLEYRPGRLNILADTLSRHPFANHPPAEEMEGITDVRGLFSWLDEGLQKAAQEPRPAPAEMHEAAAQQASYALPGGGVASGVLLGGGMAAATVTGGNAAADALPGGGAASGALPEGAAAGGGTGGFSEASTRRGAGSISRAWEGGVGRGGTHGTAGAGAVGEGGGGVCARSASMEGSTAQRRAAQASTAVSPRPQGA